LRAQVPAIAATLTIFDCCAEIQPPHCQRAIEICERIRIEGIPTIETNIQEFWRTKTNRAKKTLKLTALFTEFVDDYDAEELANHIKLHPRGTRYSPWWRAQDNTPDNAPYLLPETVHLSGEQEWGIGFQDDMRDDMEFFYEDERWSRDYLRLSRTTVWRWCNEGKLPAFKAGRGWRIQRSEVEKILAQNLTSIK